MEGFMLKIPSLFPKKSLPISFNHPSLSAENETIPSNDMPNDANFPSEQFTPKSVFFAPTKQLIWESIPANIKAESTSPPQTATKVFNLSPTQRFSRPSSLKFSPEKLRLFLGKRIIAEIKKKVLCPNDIIPFEKSLFLNPKKDKVNVSAEEFKKQNDFAIKLTLLRNILKPEHFASKQPISYGLATAAFGLGRCMELNYVLSYQILKTKCFDEITVLAVAPPSTPRINHLFIVAGKHTLKEHQSIFQLKNLPDHCQVFDAFLGIACSAKEFKTNTTFWNYCDKHFEELRENLHILSFQVLPPLEESHFQTIDTHTREMIAAAPKKLNNLIEWYHSIGGTVGDTTLSDINLTDFTTIKWNPLDQLAP